MNGEPLRRQVMIHNPQGLHVRPIAAFVGLAGQFQSRVAVFKKGRVESVDGKSAISLLTLGAEQGTEIILEVCGPDQQAAVEALVQLLAEWDKKEAQS